MNVHDIDAWIGKTLFLPLIIRLCQATRQTHFAVSRLFWFIAALDQLRIAETPASKIIAGLFSLIMMVTASFRADMPATSMMWFRMMSLGFLVFDVAHGMMFDAWKGVEIWGLVLFAEYAATIRNIPPTEVKKKAAVRAANLK